MKQQATTRVQRGAFIATNRRIVRYKDGNAWFVQSEKDNHVFYKVLEDGSCDCPDFAKRGMTCKHMYAVMAKDAVLRVTKEGA